jgi:hypothetical protein
LLQKKGVIFQDALRRRCVNRDKTTANDFVLPKQLEELQQRAAGPLALNNSFLTLQKTGDLLLIELMKAKTAPS